MKIKEGFIPFRGYRTWYRTVGECEEGRLPVLCLHGGPGAPHDYLEPLEEAAESGRMVVFYDQLGCGNSDQPHDPTLWTVDLYLEEVHAVRKALGLDRVHLLGQSWGGMLAQEYALTRPEGLVSLILASTLASIEQWVSEANRLRAELPPEVQAALDKHERAGTIDDLEYKEASNYYYMRHVCRLLPWPDCVERTFAKMDENSEVYNTMWGPTEFNASGTLQNWDILDRISEITVPTLITSGRYDEATPFVVGTIHDRIAGSEWVIFEQSAHMSHIEERDAYLQVLVDFLDRVEANR